jgi:VWFA-related protein
MIRSTAILLALMAAAAQTPQPAPPDTVIRINVNLVQVDAAVTDSSGKAVTDLKPEDFEVLQDGKRQSITNFSYISTRQQSTLAAPAARETPAKKGAPPVPPARIKPEDIRRTMAMVVDDLGLSFESMARVRQSLKKFVDTEMQPGDLVAIIRTGAGIGALQQFTADRRMLYAAIDHVKYNAMGRVGVSSFAPLGSGDGEGAAAMEERNEIFSVGTLGAIRYVVNGLRELPGRKSVVLFSENLKLFNADGMSQRVLDEVRHLTDAANRSSVVIYSVDPRGLQVHGLTAADDTRGMNPRQLAEVPMQRAQEEFNSRDGMVMLARDTGGLFLYNTNDIDGAVRKVIADSEGYYLIGYHPDASTFDPRTGQPKFHRVAVRVKRPGLQVRTRSGFFGNSDRGLEPVAHTRQAEIAHALTSPFSTGKIHVRLTPLFTNGPKGSFLNTMLYIDGKDLEFTDEPDGWHKAVIDVVAVTFGDNGQPVDSSDRTYTVRVKNDAFENARKGLIYAVSHPIAKPGAYQMRIVVRDATSEQVGSASQFIEAPDLSKGRLTLSSVIVKEQQQPGPPTPEHPEGQVPTTNLQGSAAVRMFHKGDQILYGYEILNAEVDSGQRPQLETQTRLFRDGKQVYEGKVNPLTMGEQKDPKRLMAGGTMKLGQQIAAGDYVLQVIVTDRLAKEKYRTATQWMDFEVQ